MQTALDSAVADAVPRPVAGYHPDGPDQFQAPGPFTALYNNNDAQCQGHGYTANAQIKTLCDSIKSNGTLIDTVQIDTGAGQSAVLPCCASATSNVFMLTQPSRIATAFSQTSTPISKRRVAKLRVAKLRVAKLRVA